MITHIKKLIRQLPSRKVKDVGMLENLMFNEYAGAKKSLIVGPFLVPILTDPSGPTWSTDATTARGFLPGTYFAVFNTNISTVYAATLGDDSSISALSAGTTDSSGNVGIPCPPLQWTYISTANKRFIITENDDLLVFIIKDDTNIIDETANRTS